MRYFIKRLFLLAAILFSVAANCQTYAPTWGTVGITGRTNFWLGTKNSFPLVIKTKNIEAMRVDTAQNVGVGTPTPNNRVEIKSKTANTSGLRFTNLTSASPSVATTDKVLSVNSTGDVIPVTVATQENIINFSGNTNPNNVGTVFSPNKPQDSNLIYTGADGSLWKWNGTAYVSIGGKNLTVINTVQPTPTATGNTTNKNSVFKDANGDTWVVDENGNAIKTGGASAADVAYSKMLFVDPINGLDTNTGSDNSMFKTIAKALTVATGSGYRIVLGAGIYVENPTISIPNIDIVTVAGSDRGNTVIQGTVTFTHTSSSSGIQGIAMTNLTHSGAGALYITDCQINGLLNKTSTGYIEITDTQLQGTSTTTLSAGTGMIKECLIKNMTISGAASGYTLKSNIVDADGVVTISGGAFYNIQDNSGNINTSAGNNIENGLIAQGLSSALAKQYVTNFSNKLGMLNPDLNAVPTKYVSYNETTKRLEISNIPANTSASWTTATTNPTPTGNTGTLPRFVQNTANNTLWYIDASGVAKMIQGANDFCSTVFFNTATPATATIFSLENPPLVNDNSLKNLDCAIYIGTDESTWNSDGVTYSTYVVPPSTEWVLSGTTTDAGANKTGNISRSGNIAVGKTTHSGTHNVEVQGNMQIKNDASGAGAGTGIEFNSNAGVPRFSFLRNGAYITEYAADANNDPYFKAIRPESDFRFYTRPTGTDVERFTILANGNSAVGNANPTQKFEVVSSGETNLRIWNTLANFWDLRNTAPAGNFQLVRAGSNAFFQVGITGNTTVGNPAVDNGFKFEVIGNARITTTPTISTATKALVKNPTTGEISEQLLGGLPERDIFTATAGQTTFTLTKTPVGNTEKVNFTRNGVDISNAVTVAGNVVTYVAASNGSKSMNTGDRIIIHYEAY